jgi:hypothetical protein
MDRSLDGMQEIRRWVPAGFYTIFKLMGVTRPLATPCAPAALGFFPQLDIARAVESADQIAAKAQSLGGKLIAGPLMSWIRAAWL